MEILNNKSNKQGYTLVEVLVVLALITIVLSVSIPSFSLVFNTAEKKELMEFRRDLIFARNKSVIENLIYTVKLNNINNSYQIIRNDKKLSIIKDKELSHGIALKKNNFGNVIDFYPTGAPKIGGSIELRNRKGQRIEITITPATGKVNLKDGKK